MTRNERLFIYGRREMAVLILLALMVALFAFTLGVHLGKRMGVTASAIEPAQAHSATTVNDKTPNRQDIQEQGKGVGQAADESLNQALHEEVIRTGARLEKPVQTELPKKTKGGEGDAKIAKPAFDHDNSGQESAVEDSKQLEKTVPASLRPAPAGRFTLQVGSHKSIEEARDQVNSLEASGYKPYLRPVELKGKGRWYRVFLGGYQSREEAERAGTQHKGRNEIDSFVVSHQVD